MQPSEILEYLLLSKEDLKQDGFAKQSTVDFYENQNKMGPFKDHYKNGYLMVLKKVARNFVAKNKGLSYTDIEEVLEQLSSEQLMDLFK